ncbi:FMN-binding negative transcriptional regulator [Elizabethkingia anophelis]|uniref:Negative transcriptional regulator n=1 Tax=Elizabethkingia anophelis TaxID=1117645 RepID=A0A455ZCZ6_9FLAO|nr:FMN-binding negative transcriptional regulator [Elizabethkingia anophelis]MDV3892835.1 FMN-binding negative transcriptional regulator [Elizabethkingia anophelis]MDV3916396.1 FMN-binding negative transcriptional regulator [Elizabethkingia anophelis]MDV3919332.1 FMN-binding negative transcriptional regulator [Elizabethkingia anophelis]MDV3934324.1 FMN-binding negative transcriptional regulator [Elizabethkingia anophelis]MDV3958393.1 FMN-binding negative transcriptional regulator [Elizabethkin
MYIPSHFQFQDNAEKIAFMKRYSFATIVTVKDNLPIATHLPFFIDDLSDKLLLSSHFAKANEQHKYIEENISLVIFSEPHAYISPANYDKRESVPTWDYIAVHAYGKAKILEDETAKAAVLEQMIHFYEEDYMQQWENLNDKFKKGMMKGIVGFEIEITDLQGQKKLSQNKTETEKHRIAQNLSKSINMEERVIADYIKKL